MILEEAIRQISSGLVLKNNDHTGVSSFITLMLFI